LSEVTLGDTILDGLVEVSIKCSCGGDIDCVVGLNVFLDGLSAICRERKKSKVSKGDMICK
jgi:hypothetical protein